MARRKKEEAPEAKPAAEAAAAAGKPAGKSNLVPALIVAAGLVAGGFLMGRGGSGDAASAAASATTTTAEAGGVAILDPVTMNLADGHYLKVTLGLQLKKGVDPKEFKATGQAAKALDITMSQLSHFTSAELQPPAKRDEVRAHLSESVAEVFDGEVLRTYVTEWVVQ